ncbi:MAG: hypothetical protein D6759_05010 [Chloroflexi bacterium]|nr:MAG: hypothetical protein D6759_05010 [Chloroflexota bacterium]
MKPSRLILSLMVVGLLFLIPACGGGESATPTPTPEPIIKTAAAEMNLSAADLGADWSVTGEETLETMKQGEGADLPPYLQDASMRTFETGEIGDLVVSIIFRTESVDSAKEEMAGGVIQDLAKAFQEQMPSATVEPLSSPDVGDEAVMIGGSESTLGLNVYVITFRKANIIAMLMVMGPQGSATEETTLGYAHKLEAKIR